MQGELGMHAASSDELCSKAGYVSSLQHRVFLLLWRQALCVSIRRPGTVLAQQWEERTQQGAVRTGCFELSYGMGFMGKLSRNMFMFLKSESLKRTNEESQNQNQMLDDDFNTTSNI